MPTTIKEAAVNYVEGVATALIGKLGQLLIEEYQLLAGVRGKVAYLRDDVAIMNAVLRMVSDSEANEDAVNHFVQEWMKQVRELAYDAEDCIDIFVRRIRRVPRGTWWIDHQMLKLIITFPARHQLATDIQDLRARALAIAERRTLYGIDGTSISSRSVDAPSTQVLPVVDAPSTQVLPVGDAPSTQVIPVVDDPNLVGIQGQVTLLLGRLTPPKYRDMPDQTRKVFSIVGSGGVGKTTLALNVCRKESNFDCKAIVPVSHAFDAKYPDRLRAGMIRQLVENFGKIDATNDEVNQHLTQQRYLIVIDDVWTISAWLAILSILPADNNRSSRIIVTTRSETVARACSGVDGNYIHNANALNDEDSKTLFLQRAIGSINEESCPKELKPHMDTILRKCSGLPLAIVNIASVLAGDRSPHFWERICRSMGSQMEMNPILQRMRQVIALSYNFLPHHLKACTMYLSIFPEDYVINKQRLLRRWIAEGFIPEKMGLTSLEVAQDYFDELLSRNVIQPDRFDEYDGPVNSCRVHDMMLEVIVSKCLEANFVSFVGSLRGGKSYDTVIRRLSIQGDLASSGTESMSMRHVRSLSSFGFEGQAKVVDQLGQFTLLRVLDLEDCKDVRNHHLKQICQLFLLCFLNLNETDITVLPSEISNLQHLQTLWLYDTLLMKVPETVTSLYKLETLSFRNRNEPEILLRLPLGLQNMKALQVLDRLELRENDVKLAEEIGELVQLRELGIVLKGCTEPVLKNLASSIGKIHSLRDLCAEELSNNQLTILFQHIGSPPQLLRKLMIGGMLPSWVESLRYLVDIELQYINLNSRQIYGALHKIPNLLKITLGNGCCSDENLEAKTEYRFPKLKELAIANKEDDNLRNVIFEENAMDELEKLTMCFHTTEQKLVGISFLKSLKEVKLCGEKTVLDAVVRVLHNPNDCKIVRKYDVSDATSTMQDGAISTTQASS